MLCFSLIPNQYDVEPTVSDDVFKFSKIAFPVVPNTCDDTVFNLDDVLVG